MEHVTFTTVVSFYGSMEGNDIRFNQDCIICYQKKMIYQSKKLWTGYQQKVEIVLLSPVSSA